MEGQESDMLLLLRVQIGMGQGEAEEKIENKNDGSWRVITGNRDYIVKNTHLGNMERKKTVELPKRNDIYWGG